MAKRRENPAQQEKLLKKAEQRKWTKFTLSGLFIIVVGIVLIAIGLLLNTGAYSAEGLLIGLGAFVVLGGVIRVLIGIINPAVPEDLRPYNADNDYDESGYDKVDDQLFEHEGDRNRP